jgi:hypothetical protein
VVLLFATVAPLHAQKRLSFAADLGLTDGEGHGGDYDNRKLQGFRFAASARFGSERLAIFAEGAKESLGTLYGDKPTCRVGANGQCVPSYPYMYGWSSSIGVLLRPRHFLESRLGIGPAHYTVRGQDGVGLNGLVGLADIALYPLSHVGLAFAIQQVSLSRYRGDRLSVRPFTVAFRVR